MNMHVRAAAACLSLFALASAQAALSPIASTPENDVLDSVTGLTWIKVANPQDGVALGYRLATEGEALLVGYEGYMSASDSKAIYALGVDRTGDNQIGDTRYVRYAVSYGQVVGANGQMLLAGYSYDTPYSTGSTPDFGYATYHFYVGEQSLFADVVPEGTFGYFTPRSRVLDGTGLACRAGGCFPGNTLWTGALVGGHGYFMVRSAVPEPANVALMALGLMGLLSLKIAKTSRQA